MDWFSELHPVLQALIGGLISWGMTALGASAVFFFRTIKESLMKMMLGFATGVMIAALFWSLLAPAIEFSEENGQIAWLPPVIGFLLGGLFLRLLDCICSSRSCKKHKRRGTLHTALKNNALIFSHYPS